MNDTAPRPPGPLALAENLIRTMQDEHDTLVRLEALFAEHRDALHERRQDRMHDATNRTNDDVSALARHRQARERQQRLLGRVLRLEGDAATLSQIAEVLRRHDGGEAVAAALLELRAGLRARAALAQQQCQDLEFALTYALDLGRDLIHALQGADPAVVPSRVYTSKGDTARSTPGRRSLLNKMG